MSNLTERRNAAFARLAKERDEALAEVARLRGVLELIRDNGGTTTDFGLSCNGSWCGEQARRALEEPT